MWNFISSPPNWWVIFKKVTETVGIDTDPEKLICLKTITERIAFPIVGWRILADNRAEGDMESAVPYGEPLIMSGDGVLTSVFSQGNYSEDGTRCDWRENWRFDYTEFIPSIHGTLEKPKGDVIFWKVLE